MRENNRRVFFSLLAFLLGLQFLGEGAKANQVDDHSRAVDRHHGPFHPNPPPQNPWPGDRGPGRSQPPGPEDRELAQVQIRRNYWGFSTIDIKSLFVNELQGDANIESIQVVMESDRRSRSTASLLLDGRPVEPRPRLLSPYLENYIFYVNSAPEQRVSLQINGPAYVESIQVVYTLPVRQLVSNLNGRFFPANSWIYLSDYFDFREVAGRTIKSIAFRGRVTRGMGRASLRINGEPLGAPERVGEYTQEFKFDVNLDTREMRRDLSSLALVLAGNEFIVERLVIEMSGRGRPGRGDRPGRGGPDRRR